MRLTELSKSLGRRATLDDIPDAERNRPAPVSVSDLRDGGWQLRDRLSDARYDRDGGDLEARGLYLDEPGSKAYVFLLTRQR